ncbi:MAG: response regulator [Lachnospiraceae bacterium]|nr:response regulator [Lachnospiraceae bacterium]
MDNILIIERAKSYLMESLKSKIKEDGINVVTEKPDINAISKLKDSFAAIIIYGDEDMKDEIQTLNYIKDRANEEGISIFVVGAPEEYKAINITIPKHLVAKVYTRPINVNTVAEDLKIYMEKYSKGNKKTILVVDDSGAMLRNVKGWLEASYNVALANSGTMAIKYLATNTPDLILLDYEMPVLDGKQVLEMIRSESEFCDIPVVFLTSKDDKESVMKVMALKPEGYLLKTMEPSKIVQYINDFFEKRKAMI